MIMKVFTTHLNQNLMMKMINNKIKNQQNNDIGTKPPNVFNYLKSLSPEAKDLMDEIEDDDDDIDINKVAFIGIDRKI